jgi:hypothetical protein
MLRRQPVSGQLQWRRLLPNGPTPRPPLHAERDGDGNHRRKRWPKWACDALFAPSPSCRDNIFTIL